MSQSHAVYRRGLAEPDQTLADVVASLDDPDAFAWIELEEPSAQHMTMWAEALGLPDLAVEDAIHAHQRPKIERHGATVFVSLKTATYVDPQEVIRLGEVMAFVGDGYLLTVSHGADAELLTARAVLDEAPLHERRHPVEALYRVVDEIVDGYLAVLPKLDVDIDEIQGTVFDGSRQLHTERIFRLKREVLAFRQAVEPLTVPLSDLFASLELDSGSFSAGLPARFRDIHDHVLRVATHLRGVDSLLDSALAAHATHVGMQQNEDMRKISAWAAIAAVPTAVGAIYGMNFEHMPELSSSWGYPTALGAMALGSFALYRTFKRRGWL